MRSGENMWKSDWENKEENCCGNRNKLIMVKFLGLGIIWAKDKMNKSKWERLHTWKKKRHKVNIVAPEKTRSINQE